MNHNGSQKYVYKLDPIQLWFNKQNVC